MQRLSAYWPGLISTEYCAFVPSYFQKTRTRAGPGQSNGQLLHRHLPSHPFFKSTRAKIVLFIHRVVLFEFPKRRWFC